MVLVRMVQQEHRREGTNVPAAGIEIRIRRGVGVFQTTSESQEEQFVHGFLILL